MNITKPRFNAFSLRLNLNVGIVFENCQCRLPILCTMIFSPKLTCLGTIGLTCSHILSSSLHGFLSAWESFQLSMSFAYIRKYSRHRHRVNTLSVLSKEIIRGNFGLDILRKPPNVLIS